jgi:fumarate reductase subunit D
MTQPAAQPAASDKVTLWGVLGIVFAICCPILGIVFSILSLLEAKKVGKPQTLAYVGFVIAGLNILLNIILAISGNAYWAMNR